MMNVRVLTRRSVLTGLLLLGAQGACSAFGGSDTSVPPAADAGVIADASLDASMATALGDADAGPPGFPGTSFCADAGRAIFCDDFDEPGRDAGWKASVKDAGELSVGATFMSGSSPNALAATLGDAGGAAYLVSVPVPVGSKGVSVDIDYSTSSTQQSVNIARAGFGSDPDVLQLVGLAGAKILCLGFANDVPVGPVPGAVHVHITGLGTEQVNCYVNGALLAATAKVVPANFQLEVGASGSGTASAIRIDNILITDTP